jgi:hypothetical protein
LFGDFKAMEVYQDQNKFLGHYVRDKAIEKPHTYSWIQAGMQRILMINDPQVFKEFA